eukprot:g5285.t1
MTCLNLRSCAALRRSDYKCHTPSHSTCSSLRHPASFLNRYDRLAVRVLGVNLIDELDAQLQHRIETTFDREADPQSPSAYEQNTTEYAEVLMELEDNFNKQQTSALTERKALERQWSSQIVVSPIRGKRRRRHLRVKSRSYENQLLPKTPTSMDEIPKEGKTREELEEAMLTRLELQLLTKTDTSDSIRPLGQFKQLPLLTQFQEVILGTIVQRAAPLIAKRQQLKKQLSRTPSIDELSKAMEMPIEQVSKLMEARQKAKGVMLHYNIRLVLFCARQYRNSCPQRHYGDLISEGMGSKGLGRAVDRFDPTLGIRFSTYAAIWIKQIMSECLRNDLASWRIPQHVRTLLSKIYQSVRKLATKENGGQVTIEAISKDLEVPVKRLQKYLKVAKQTVSLETEKIRGKYGDVTEGLIDSIPDPNQQPDPLEMESIETSVNLALSTLEPRERNVLKMRYGLGTSNGRTKTLAEIGLIYNLSIERVRQIEEKAKRKLRKPWRKLLLDPDNVRSRS